MSVPHARANLMGAARAAAVVGAVALVDDDGVAHVVHERVLEDDAAHVRALHLWPAPTSACSLGHI